MRFSFMTFSCPELTWREVLTAATRFGYDGVEPRAQAKHAHGIETTASPGQRALLRQMADDAGIAICCLATSCAYAASPGELSRMIGNSRALIALAHDLGAPAMRVFGGQIPQGMSRDHAETQVAECLSKLADDARAAGVALCVETHDSWCDARLLARVLGLVAHPNVQANWDIMHPVNGAGMTMDAAFAALRPFVRHVHFHDGRRNDKGALDLCPIGEGIIDHRRAVQLLRTIAYQGHLSGEWIAWEPWQTHLPRELATMKNYLG